MVRAIRRFQREQVAPLGPNVPQQAPFPSPIADLAGDVGAGLLQQELSLIQETKQANEQANSLRIRNQADELINETLTQLQKEDHEDFAGEYEKRINPLISRLKGSIPRDKNQAINEEYLRNRFQQGALKADQISFNRMQDLRVNEIQRLESNILQNVLADPFDFGNMTSKIGELQNEYALAVQNNVFTKAEAQYRLNKATVDIQQEMFEAGLGVDIQATKESLDGNLYGFPNDELDNANNKLDAYVAQETAKQHTINTAAFHDQIRSDQLNDVKSEFQYFLGQQKAGLISEAQINPLASALYHHKQRLFESAAGLAIVDNMLAQGRQLMTDDQAEINLKRNLKINSKAPNPKDPMIVMAESDIQAKRASKTSKNFVESAARADEYDEGVVTGTLDYLSRVKEEAPWMLDDFDTTAIASMEFIATSIQSYGGDAQKGFNAAKKKMFVEGTAEYQGRLDQAATAGNDVNVKMNRKMDQRFNQLMPNIPGTRILTNFTEKIPIAGSIQRFSDKAVNNVFDLLGGAPDIDENQRQAILQRSARAYALTGDIEGSTTHGIDWFNRNYKVVNGEWEFKPLYDEVYKHFKGREGETVNQDTAIIEMQKIVAEAANSASNFTDSGWDSVVVDGTIPTAGFYGEIAAPLALPDMLGSPSFNSIVVFEPMVNTRHKTVPDYRIKIRKKGEPSVFIYLRDNNNQTLSIRGMPRQNKATGVVENDIFTTIDERLKAFAKPEGE